MRHVENDWLLHMKAGTRERAVYRHLHQRTAFLFLFLSPLKGTDPLQELESTNSCSRFNLVILRGCVWWGVGVGGVATSNEMIAPTS